MNVQHYLDAAADHIERVGWRQSVGDRIWTSDRGACVMEAIWFTLPGYADDGYIYPAVKAELLRRIHPDREYDREFPSRVIWRWNDEEGRTKEDVIVMLRGATMNDVQEP